MERQKIFWKGLLAAFTLICLGSGTVFAESIRAKGLLTLIDSDGTVVIDEKGYEVARSAEILDKEGKRVSLRALTPPLKVDYEYEFTKGGPVIKQIKEQPKVVPQ